MKLLRVFSDRLFAKRKGSLLKSKDVTEKEHGLYLALIPILWMIMFFVIPVLIIFKISFSTAIFNMPPFSEIFSSTADYLLEIKINFKNYIAAVRNQYYLEAFVNSIKLSTLATAACLFLGFAMAYGIHNAKEKTASTLLLFVSLSFWTSFLIRIYSWMNLLSIHGIVNSILMKFGVIDEPIQFLGSYYTVCLGLVFCYLPFMIFPVYAVLEKIDNSYIEAAHDLGCHPTATFWSITVPLARAGILTGSILVFTASTGEFVIPELLGKSDTVTFGKVLWTEFFTNLDWPMACALSIIMMIFIVLPVFLFQRKTRI